MDAALNDERVDVNEARVDVGQPVREALLRVFEFDVAAQGGADTSVTVATATAIPGAVYGLPVGGSMEERSRAGLAPTYLPISKAARRSPASQRKRHEWISSLAM